MSELNNKIASVLIQWAGERREYSKFILKKYGTTNLMDGSQLMQSLTFDAPVIEGNKIVIKINANDYYKFVDQGVSGSNGGYTPPKIQKGVRKRNPTGVFKFKNDRVHPDMPMVKSIAEWITTKPAGQGVKGAVRVNKKEGTKGSVIPRRDSLAYAYAKSIKRRGIGSTMFWTDTYNEDSFSDLAEMIAKALGGAFNIQIKI